MIGELRSLHFEGDGSDKVYIAVTIKNLATAFVFWGRAGAVNRHQDVNSGEANVRIEEKRKKGYVYAQPYHNDMKFALAHVEKAIGKSLSFNTTGQKGVMEIVLNGGGIEIEPAVTSQQIVQQNSAAFGDW